MAPNPKKQKKPKPKPEKQPKTSADQKSRRRRGGLLFVTKNQHKKRVPTNLNQGRVPPFLRQIFKVKMETKEKQQGFAMHRPNKTTAHTTPTSAHSNIAQTPLRGHDISGDWWPQAELVDRSLLAYTPAPSNPSSMGAFVP